MRNPFAHIAKRETARSSLKERAASLKATAGRVMKRQAVQEAAMAAAPSPALVGMVAEWERLLHLENRGCLGNEGADPIMWERAALIGRISAVRPPCHRHTTDDALTSNMGHQMGAGHPSSIARGLGRMRRLHRVLLACAGHEASLGNVITAAILVAVYMAS